MCLFHAALQAKVDALDLDVDGDLITALRCLHESRSKKQAIACMKETLLLFKDRLDACQQLSGNQMEILSELLFIPDSIHLHQSYVSFISTLPAEVRLAVEKSLAARISVSQDATQYPHILTAVQSLMKPSVFEGLIRNRAMDIIHIIVAVLESIHQCKGLKDTEEAHKRCTMAATIGYIIVSTYSDTLREIEEFEEILQTCSHVAGVVMKNREFVNVEITMSLLIYSIMVALESNPKDASVIVLLCILGEDSSLVQLKRNLSSTVYGSNETSLMTSQNALNFQKLTSDLSDRQRLLFLKAISHSLLDALSCENGILLVVFNKIFGSVSETYQVDPWSKIYYMDSVTSLLKGLCRKRVNSSGDDALFGQMTTELEEHALSIAFDNLDHEEVIVIRSAQTLLQEVLNVDKIRSSCHSGSTVTMNQVLQYCSRLDSHDKSKYRILHCLEKYVTAGQVLEENPNFIDDTLQAIAKDRAIKSLASSALAFIWRQLYFNKPNNSKSFGDFLDKDHSMDAISRVLHAMLNKDESVQSAVTLYVLPGLVKNCRESFHVLLESFMSETVSKDETWLASCLSLLSFGKKESVYENIRELETQNLPIFRLLGEALLTESSAVHLSALELLVTSAKTVNVPGKQELDLLWKYFNMAIRCTSKSSRQENIAIFSQFLKRIKVSVAATLTRPSDFSEEAHADVKLAEAWLRQFCRLCLSCLHPGGVYGKKYMGVEFLCMILEAFNVLIAPDPRQPKLLKRNAPYMNMFQDKDAGQGLKYGSFRPFPEELYCLQTTEMLWSALLDVWDRISTVSVSILLMLPSPIPGIESVGSVSQVLDWALRLLKSPRSVESDSGAKVLMVLFIKYVCECQWSVRLHPHLSCTILHEHGVEKHSLEMEFVHDLISLSDIAFSEAEEDLASASKSGIAHGYLLALRYICPYMTVDHASQAAQLMTQVYNLLEKGSQIVIPLLASPDESVMADDLDMLTGTHSKAADDEHFIRGSAWINSKEICHMIETMWVFCDRSDLMRACQGVLEKMAELLLGILLQAKHYGAIDHARAALHFVCKKSNDWGLSKLSELLLEHLFSEMMRGDQSRRDAIRRSGGLPFAITAILVPHAKSYLPVKAMERLLEVMRIDTGHEKGIYWPKVHALNTLRLILSESKLSSLETFYADGFGLILMSFSDPNWEIRNAASLCFASLVTKVMGFSNTEHREHAEFWPKRSPTASQFFQKYAAVDIFIAEVLKRYGASAESMHSCSESELLSPILALLCRLRPSCMAGHEHHSATCLRYAKILKNCSTSRQMAIRKFAARAFVSVVPALTWDIWSEELSTNIAEELSSKEVDWNQIHGHILILKEILRVHYSCTKQPEAINKALCRQVGRSIRENIRFDCLKKVLCCPPVLAELLQVCILLARLNEAEDFDIECFEYYGDTALNLWPVFMSDRKINNNIPSISKIKKRLSKLKFTWVFPILSKMNHSNDMCAAYVQETHKMLQCPDYEVRDAVLKCFLANFEIILLPQINRDDGVIVPALCSLYETLRVLWIQEGAFYPRIHMLQTLNMMHGYLSPGKHLMLKDSLVDCYNTSDSKNPALLQELIIYSMQDALYHKTKDAVIFALDMILTYSHPQHPANVRQACVQSLKISGLMNPYNFNSSPPTNPATNIPSHISMDQYMELWCSVLRLLEDEEPDIRMETSSSLQRDMLNKDEKSRERYGSIRVEEMQDCILPWLGGALSQDPSFISHLQSWICIPEDCRKRVHQALATKDDATIFKEETANQHTDPLILANLASTYLAQLATGGALSEEQQHGMHTWLGQTMSALEDFIHSCKDLNGIIYQELLPSIYEDVYRLVAALWTASHLTATTIQSQLDKFSTVADESKHIGDQKNLVVVTFAQPAISALMASALEHPHSSTPNSQDNSLFKISTRWQII